MLPSYPFWWSDYSGDAFSLTQGQHGAYFLLLRHIYTEGRPIPHDQRYSIARALLEQEQANVDAVLSRYFTREGESWTHLRAFSVIDEFNAKHQRRVNAGKNGGNAKAAKSGNALAMPKQSPSNQIQNQNQDKEDLLNGDNGGDKIGEGFEIGDWLTPEGLAEAREAAPGWDMHHLRERYNAWVRGQTIPRNPEKAFIGWIKKFTKGKPPS